MKKFLAIAALAVCAGGAAQAGTIERACLSSERASGNRALCGCIQHVADLTLDRRDQRLAAKFFRDPHQAQVVRQSDRRSDETFWQKYKRFGTTAETYCS
ncbi:hypothetical protein [Tranquillimonas alkanivorans]|uniref:Secreted protein n=1 Tax=Tranquillimonas alkanivorans TaxID=441119 RepID=A0A1I5SZP8_9RHOB|nr:hypothetical protein [Tranquillimonas alkanivorans]SFP75696.1 hypothetical protein SAMN04488047_11251 [Tranquillimonas alkanivorans]